ncbi:hypothetical protein PAPYR_12415 [Paratrimastix pyriformis]|uniref:Uncharacterized protein n=1 Tax=Paratrimastix pyriformis TaxID=342808 RepID=A0ABQ8U1W8_9EUKA|nr:hypothetical protein PAPYR_12415 [Paratrimastix pyriformis]
MCIAETSICRAEAMLVIPCILVRFRAELRTRHSAIRRQAVSFASLHSTVFEMLGPSLLTIRSQMFFHITL